MDLLIVDGYNMIGAWPELIELKKKDLEAARDRLVELLAEYRGFTGTEVIVVFDAYYVKGRGKKYRNYKLEIIYTKENETADERIEKLAKQRVSRRTKVYVATSDFTEQWAIFGQGAYRKSARELYNDIMEIKKGIQSNVKKIQENRPTSKIPLSDEVLDYFEKLRRGK